MIFEALSSPLVQRALIATLLVSIICGTIGVFIVVKRLSSLAGGLSHAAFGGIGLGILCGLPPLVGAVLFCLFGAVVLAVVYHRRRQSLDTLIAIFWSSGMSLGIVSLSLSPGYAPDLSTYLFGSLLFIPDTYLWLAAGVSVLTLGITYHFYRDFQAVAFDEEFSQISGLPVERLLILLLSLIALATVLLLQVTGAILTIALLTTPAVIALQWSRSLAFCMLLGGFISASSSIAGIFLGYWFSYSASLEIPTGPLIILILTLVYAISTATKAVRTSKKLD